MTWKVAIGVLALASLAIVVRYGPLLAKADALIRVELVRGEAVRTVWALHDRIYDTGERTIVGTDSPRVVTE